MFSNFVLRKFLIPIPGANKLSGLLLCCYISILENYHYFSFASSHTFCDLYTSLEKIHEETFIHTIPIILATYLVECWSSNAPTCDIKLRSRTMTEVSSSRLISTPFIAKVFFKKPSKSKLC